MLLAVIFFTGIISSYLGAFVIGGVSTFAILSMTLFGLTPQLAAITFKLGKVGNSIAVIGQYHKAKLVRKEFIIGLSFASFFGAIIGSFLIVSTPDTYIYTVSGITILALLFIDVRRYPEGESRIKKVSRIRLSLGYFFEFIATIAANISPAASGAYFYFIKKFFLGLTPLQSKALSSIVSIPWFVGTAIGIFLAGQYNLSYGAALALGMYVGGYFGTKQAIKIGDEKIKYFLRVFIFLSALYFLYLGYNSWSKI